MDKDVKDIEVSINLKSVAIPSGQEPDLMELITDGTLSRVEQEGRSGWKVVYSDGELTGFPDSSTEVICFDNDMAQMNREGDFTQCITMETGKRRSCEYTNEYGTLTLGVFAKDIINTLDNKGGELYLSYTLDANGALVTENHVLLTVTPRNK